MVLSGKFIYFLKSFSSTWQAFTLPKPHSLCLSSWLQEGPQFCKNIPGSQNKTFYCYLACCFLRLQSSPKMGVEGKPDFFFNFVWRGSDLHWTRCQLETVWGGNFEHDALDLSMPCPRLLALTIISDWPQRTQFTSQNPLVTAFDFIHTQAKYLHEYTVRF